MENPAYESGKAGEAEMICLGRRTRATTRFMIEAGLLPEDTMKPASSIAAHKIGAPVSSAKKRTRAKDRKGTKNTKAKKEKTAKKSKAQKRTKATSKAKRATSAARRASHGANECNSDSIDETTRLMKEKYPDFFTREYFVDLVDCLPARNNSERVVPHNTRDKVDLDEPQNGTKIPNLTEPQNDAGMPNMTNPKIMVNPPNKLVMPDLMESQNGTAYSTMMDPQSLNKHQSDGVSPNLMDLQNMNEPQNDTVMSSFMTEPRGSIAQTSSRSVWWNNPLRRPYIKGNKISTKPEFHQRMIQAAERAEARAKANEVCTATSIDNRIGVEIGCGQLFKTSESFEKIKLLPNTDPEEMLKYMDLDEPILRFSIPRKGAPMCLVLAMLPDNAFYEIIYDKEDTIVEVDLRQFYPISRSGNSEGALEADVTKDSDSDSAGDQTDHQDDLAKEENDSGVSSDLGYEGVSENNDNNLTSNDTEETLTEAIREQAQECLDDNKNNSESVDSEITCMNKEDESPQSSVDLDGPARKRIKLCTMDENQFQSNIIEDAVFIKTINSEFSSTDVGNNGIGARAHLPDTNAENSESCTSINKRMASPVPTEQFTAPPCKKLKMTNDGTVSEPTYQNTEEAARNVDAPEKGHTIAEIKTQLKSNTSIIKSRPDKASKRKRSEEKKSTSASGNVEPQRKVETLTTAAIETVASQSEASSFVEEEQTRRKVRVRLSKDNISAYSQKFKAESTAKKQTASIADIEEEEFRKEIEELRRMDEELGNFKREWVIKKAECSKQRDELRRHEQRLRKQEEIEPKLARLHKEVQRLRTDNASDKAIWQKGEEFATKLLEYVDSFCDIRHIVRPYETLDVKAEAIWEKKASKAFNLFELLTQQYGESLDFLRGNIDKLGVKSIYGHKQHQQLKLPGLFERNFVALDPLLYGGSIFHALGLTILGNNRTVEDLGSDYPNNNSVHNIFRVLLAYDMMQFQESYQGLIERHYTNLTDTILLLLSEAQHCNRLIIECVSQLLNRRIVIYRWFNAEKLVSDYECEKHTSKLTPVFLARRRNGYVALFSKTAPLLRFPIYCKGALQRMKLFISKKRETNVNSELNKARLP